MQRVVSDMAAANAELTSVGRAAAHVWLNDMLATQQPLIKQASWSQRTKPCTNHTEKSTHGECFVALYIAYPSRID